MIYLFEFHITQVVFFWRLLKWILLTGNVLGWQFFLVFLRCLSFSSGLNCCWQHIFSHPYFHCFVYNTFFHFRTLKMFLISPILSSMIKMSFSTFFFSFIMLGVHWASGNFALLFLSNLENIGHYFFKYFLCHPTSLSDIWIMSLLGHLIKKVS